MVCLSNLRLLVQGSQGLRHIFRRKVFGQGLRWGWGPSRASIQNMVHVGDLNINGHFRNLNWRYLP